MNRQTQRFKEFKGKNQMNRQTQRFKELDYLFVSFPVLVIGLVAIFDIPFKFTGCANFSMAAEKLSPLKSSLILRSQLVEEKLIIRSSKGSG